MKSNSALIIVNEYGKKTKVYSETGRLLSDVLSENGFRPERPCGGLGTCGKCRVSFLSGAPVPSDHDKRFLSEKELSEGLRLFCKAVVSGDCEIELQNVSEDMAIEETDTKAVWNHLGKRDPGRTFAIAIDLGTTTIAAALLEKSGNEFGIVRTASCVNRQRGYGADVISRIAAADDKDQLKDMSKLVTADMEGLMRQLLDPEMENGELTGRLDYITVAGNTTMMNLFAGRKVAWLGTYPYTAPDHGLGFEQMIADLCFEGYEEQLLTNFPGISAFVGADIVSGIYYFKCEGMNTRNALFVDLGTNGEMVYFDEDKITVTSTAAGPVFEAGGISCGVPSVPGAICHATLVRDGDRVRCDYETIGGKPAIGLCGTGVMELVSEAIRVGLVDETGLLEDPYFDEGFPVTEDGSIRLTQKDIRNLQLAKAAIFTGAESLLNGRIPEAVYLAGGFGSHINMDRIRNLKMFPEGFDGKIIPVGNTSLKGAISFSKRALMGGEERERAGEELIRIAEKATVVELATLDEFDTNYIEAMNF